MWGTPNSSRQTTVGSPFTSSVVQPLSFACAVRGEKIKRVTSKAVANRKLAARRASSPQMSTIELSLFIPPPLGGPRSPPTVSAVIAKLPLGPWHARHGLVLELAEQVELVSEMPIKRKTRWGETDGWPPIPG